MTSSKIQDGRPHVRVRVVIGAKGERTLYWCTNMIAYTCERVSLRSAHAQ